MSLTPDEKAVLDAYRKAKRRRQVLHIVPQAATVKIYTFKQEEAQSVGIVPTKPANIDVLYFAP